MRMRLKQIAVTVFIFLFSMLPIMGYGQTTPAYNDEIIPQVIKAVSPSVVGIIGNRKDIGDSSYNIKYSEDMTHGTGVIIKSNGKY